MKLIQKWGKILRSSEQVESYIDGKICRVIYNYPINELKIKKSEVEIYKNDILFFSGNP